jgi:uncharacterized membrane protein YkvA (DUF1232 family)
LSFSDTLSPYPEGIRIGGQILKLKDFRQSKWVKAAQDPRAESRLKTSFPKWINRVNNLNLVRRAKELWGYLVSDKCSGGDKLLVMGALIYLVSPIDLIPDWIPVVGWLDDIGVATAVLAYLNGKLDEATEIANTEPDFVKIPISGHPGEHSRAEDDPFKDLMPHERPTIVGGPFGGLGNGSRTLDGPYADLSGERPNRK